ncbi:MAG TPA: DUF1569 domain-containing protein [Blastocatellia bacterium]|nr:DUF1569 domain-containing protein [Blastocatellia bacterium]HMV82891.1 DUF1569 domain-containing protein [Blastocatellia bacterium]HMX30355.1 DUF1569 domain-containing protein [Blastocatellia bacterium]HMZ22254.1 DUF1569 domain-containing protein [Blastocatellia bacterium]HNG29562.1 DUF1569 domain-containing protein [Blastocatellia bacterium]
MKSIWQSDACEELLARAEQLQPTAPAQWGKFNCPRMLTHVTDGLRMATGELQVAPKKTPLKFTPIKQLVIYWLPFPKGVPTAPELLSRSPGEWAAEIKQFQEALRKFAADSERRDWPEHPAFGKLTAKDWGVLIYRHIDHHFKQFGV